MSDKVQNSDILGINADKKGLKKVSESLCQRVRVYVWAREENNNINF